MSASDPDQSPLASPAQDFRKLKANGSAAAQELTGWLAKMRGKSPVEVLGAVANSNLIRSFVQAAIGVAVFIFVFTVIPWTVSLIRGDSGEAAVAETVSEPTAEEAEEAGETPPDEGTPTEAEGTPKGPDIDLGNQEAIADQLGVGETKEAPANVNPLDGSVDDLLEGLE